jgi:type I restriction enzyme, S subunit
MADWKEIESRQMPADWALKTVDEIKAMERKSIISGPFGSNISSKFFVPDGIPVIRGNNLSLNVGKRFIDDGFVFLTEDKANELGTWATKDDLIFTAAGTIGQVGILTGNEKHSRYIISNKQLRVRLDRSIVDPLFAYYWFASPFITNTINGRDTGSTIPLINLSVLKGLPIPLPPLPEQQAIAQVLSSLDDKIDLLHRQNKTLEVLAETLFRQWFVEEAEANWEKGFVTDLVDLNPKRSLSKETVAPYLEMSNLSNELYHPHDWYDRKFTSGTKFINGDTLLARITPCLENGKTAYVDFLKDDEVGWGSTEFIIMRSKAPLHPFFSYILARHSDFRNFVIGCMVGSSGRQRADVENIATYEMQLPPQSVINRFNDYIEPSLQKMKINNNQIRTLTTLRDTLLPKLMNGEVRVKIDEEETATAG